MKRKIGLMVTVIMIFSCLYVPVYAVNADSIDETVESTSIQSEPQNSSLPTDSEATKDIDLDTGLFIATESCPEVAIEYAINNLYSFLIPEVEGSNSEIQLDSIRKLPHQLMHYQSDIKSWLESSTALSVSISESYSVSKGQYRVATYYYVSGDGGSESNTVYSKTVKY